MKAVYKILNNQDKVTMEHFYHIRCVPDLDEGFCTMQQILCACTGCVEQLYNHWIKLYNHIMLSKPKYVGTLPSYMAIINGILHN